MKFQMEFNFFMIFILNLFFLPNIYTIKSNSLNSINDDFINLKANNLYEQKELKITDYYFYQEIILVKDENYDITFERSFRNYDILLTILGNSLSDFEIKAYYNGWPAGETTLKIKKYFYNGYAIILKNTINCKNLRLQLSLSKIEKESINIRARPINKKNQFVIQNNHTDIILGEETIQEECFKLYIPKEEDNDTDIDSNEEFFLEENLLALKFLTYTQNIVATLKEGVLNEDKIINIDKVWDTAIIEDYQYSEICFKLKDNSINYGSLSFEILNFSSNIDSNDIFIFNNFSLIRGFPSEQYLPEGYAIVYKTDDYKFKDKVSLMDVKFHMIQGKSKLFIKECESYPFCNYEIGDLKNSYEEINGYISVKKILDTNWKKYVAVVYCPNNDNDMGCKYEISMKNEDELTYLYKNKISYSFINSNLEPISMENYIINLENDFSQSDILYIYFNLFSGNASLQFFSNDENKKDYEVNYLGNQKIYIFKNKANLLHIQINNDNNAYFNIHYELKNDENINQYYVEEGILLFGKLPKNSKNSYIISKFEKEYYPIIASINTYGNNIEIKDSHLINYPDLNLIQLIIKDKIEEQYSFNIESKEENSIFNIILSNKNTKIQMNNGYNYINQLNENNKEATYIYFFTKEKDNNLKLVINFRKFSKNPVNITINTKSNGNNNYIVKRLSKIILLDNNEINNVCDYLEGNKGITLCKIIIKIKSENGFNISNDNSTYIDFSIQITANDDHINLIYLPQNIIISNLLIPYYSQKYYVEVPKNGIGKIYIDFMEGGGNPTATLEYEDKPARTLIFDYFNKYFEITNDMTQNCKAEGYCKIYIDLKTDKNIYKYNIYSKLKTNNEEMKSFFVPEYEYIYGNLKESELHNYKTKISKESKKIIFNFYCDNCNIELSYNKKNFPIDTYGYKQFILDSEKEDNINNFYGKIIHFSIKIKEPRLTNEQNYNFRIITPESTQTIIPMTSIRNEFCKIGKNSPCYLMIPIEKYNKIEFIRIFVPEEERTNILYKKINYKDYDESNEEDLIDKITDKSDSDNIQKNFFELQITRDGDNYEKIFAIKIESNFSSEITVISSHYNLMDYKKLNLQLNDYSLIKLNKTNKNINLAYSEGIFDFEANLIKGKGKIKISGNSEKEYILDYKIQENIYLFVNSEVRENKEIEAEIYKEEEEFIIYIRTILTNKQNKLVPLYFQRNNYFNYIDINYDESIWPLNFYMKLNISSDDFKGYNNEYLKLKNINLNYKFSNINDYDIKDYNEKIFEIKIFLVNQSYINQIKIDPDKEELLNENLKYQSNYRVDLTAGYSLIEAKNLYEYINKNSTYLYIKIIPPSNFINNNNINIMLSAFDLTSDYYLPLNEYLLMSINEETKINLGRKLSSYNNLIFELVLDDEISNFAIISQNKTNFHINDTDVYKQLFFGKTILNKKYNKYEKTNILSLFNIQKRINFQNLLIKNRISNSNELNYFTLKNGNISFDDENFKITSFEKIEENQTCKIEDGYLNIIYNIRIYNYTDKSEDFSNTILNNEKPLQILKYNNMNLDLINGITIGNLTRGLFYLSILAEARKGNIYEYFTYNPKEIKNITENATIDIIINTTKQYTKGQYAKSFIIKAKIQENDKGDFIKLSLKHKNKLDENNYIFASYDEDLLNESTDLYNKSEYKTIDREESLIIPTTNEENLILYIRIPCNDVCDFVLNHVLYKKENIEIDNDECFDIEIDKISQKQNFQYKNNETTKSLFTITSYSVNDFGISAQYNGKTVEFNKTYFNGYSFISIPSFWDSNEELLFTIEGDLMVKICHHALYQNREGQYESKDIVIGDKIYTRIERGKEQCFKIHKKNENKYISNYMLSFISKTKNIKVKFYDSANKNFENLTIDEESDSIILDSKLDKLCISKNKENNDNNDVGLLIHLLSINKENMISQNLTMPLIRGISTRQILKKGQIIYYRINENLNKRYLINVHFQNITGNTKIFYENCTDFPKCSFTQDKISNEKKNIFNNNINFKISLEDSKEKIYHKSEFPVIVIYCENGGKDFCNYYIEISTDVDSIILNKNRRIYSSIEENLDEHKYKISLAKNEINIDENKEKKLYVQIYSFIGSASFIINDIGHTTPNTKIKNYYQFNNNTILFVYNLTNSISEFNIKVTSKQKSYYNIFYYIIDENERNIYLPSGEVHYSIITKPNFDYYYYFQDKKLINESKPYFININPINCEIKYSKKTQQNNYIINSNENIIISYQDNKENKAMCEFTISANEFDENKKLKDLLVIDGIYQKYHLEKNNITKLNYLIPTKDINNKTLLININKKTEENLTIEYSYNINDVITKKNINNNNEIIDINLKDIIMSNDTLEELYNFIILKVKIYLENIESQDNIDFKIRINENNLPTYLNSEEIEYGIINKGSYIYYYFDYKKYENIKIYFNCKGKASFKVVQDVDKYYKELPNPNYLYYNNKYNLKKEDDLEKSNYNYVNINNCNHDVCQAYIYIFISDKDKNNERAIFNIYRYSENNVINIPLNQNFEGVLLNKMPNYFYTDINFNGIIKIVLNCRQCKMCYGDIKDKIECPNPFVPSRDKYLLINSIYYNNKLNYFIYTDKQDYVDFFSIYIFNSDLPKLINQNTLENCETPCKFLLPIYQFYYIKNNSNILLYVPDDENTIIYEKIVKMEEGNNNLKGFYIINDYNNTSKDSFISNKLIINFDEIKNNNNNSEDLYMEIQINSKTNEDERKNITFITSLFYDSLNSEVIPQYQNFFMINENNITKIDILKNSIKNNFYKVDINLIEGSGKLINEKDKSEYSISYATQEGISLILKSDNNNYNLEEIKNLDEKSFIFYMSINEKEIEIEIEKGNKKENSFDELLFGKTNYLNYYKEIDKNIFPIQLRLNINNIKDLHINLHFSKLIRQIDEKDKNPFIDVFKEIFRFRVFTTNILNSNKKHRKEIFEVTKYYSYLRRGYIHLTQDILSNFKFVEIEISKFNNNKDDSYESVSLEVTAFGLNNDVNSILELPRNNYLEMNITNKRQEIKLIKPFEEYKNTYLELSSKDKLNLDISNSNFSENRIINGYNYYSILNDSQKEYNLILSSSSKIDTLFMKYISAKDNITQFKLKNTKIECTRIDENNYKFKCIQSNIIPGNIPNNNYNNYNLTLLIRLYNSFSFEDNKEPDKILIDEIPNQSFRKELTEEELNKDSIEYIIDFGPLIPSKYYINVLGEVIYGSNVEYFLYDNYDFNRKKKDINKNFDFTWLIIIFILIIMFIFVIYFLVKKILYIRNNKEDEEIAKKKELIFLL